MILIRKAIPQDKPEGLISKGTIREGRGDLVMVVLEEDSLIGCCSMEIQGARGIINSLYMIESKRDQGIGYGLVKNILYSAQKQNVEWVEVPASQKTMAFFKKMDFEPTHENSPTLQLKLDGIFNSCCCGGDGECGKGC